MEKLVAYAGADFHFPERAGGGAWVGIPEITGDAIHALTRTVDMCVRDRAPLLAAGDIFDGPDPEPVALADVYDQLHRLGNAGLAIYYILGNHDRGRDWLRPLGPMAINVSGISTRLSTGPTITGLSCISTVDIFILELSKLAKTDIGLYHQCWQELVSAGSFSLKQIPTHKISICGDIHTNCVLDKPEFSHTIISPGPLSPQSIAEFEPTKIYAIVSDTAHNLSFREILIPGRNYIRYELTGPEDADLIITKLAAQKPTPSLPKNLSKPFVCIRLSGTVPTGFTDTVSALAQERGFIIKISTTKPHAQRTVDVRTQSTTDLHEAIHDWAISSEAKQLASSLVKPGVDLRKVLQEFKEATIATPIHRAS